MARSGPHLQTPGGGGGHKMGQVCCRPCHLAPAEPATPRPLHHCCLYPHVLQRTGMSHGFQSPHFAGAGTGSGLKGVGRTPRSSCGSRSSRRRSQSAQAGRFDGPHTLRVLRFEGACHVHSCTQECRVRERGSSRRVHSEGRQWLGAATLKRHHHTGFWAHAPCSHDCMRCAPMCQNAATFLGRSKNGFSGARSIWQLIGAAKKHGPYGSPGSIPTMAVAEIKHFVPMAWLGQGGGDGTCTAKHRWHCVCRTLERPTAHADCLPRGQIATRPTGGRTACSHRVA